MKPSVFLTCAVAVLAIAGCNSKQGDAATGAPVKLQQVKPPPGGDWSQVVNATPAGGFIMGNPNAKSKLIEFGSMTCPHCREFDEKGTPQLIAKYVKSGQVSWEFRNYVRDPWDLTAALVARCNGANSFFPLTRALYKDQPNWVATISKRPPAELEKLTNLPPTQEFQQAAKIAGLQQWAAMRGVPMAKSSQCLTNENSINQLVQMTSDAVSQYPNFAGTPTFVLNGSMLEKTANWETLEPALKSAVGGR